MTYEELKNDILHDPATHYWLANAVRSLENKDPVDALLDAGILYRLQKLRCDEMTRQQG